MDVNIIKLALLATVTGLASCGSQAGIPNDAAKAVPSQRCVTAEQNVDSSFVLAQARRALSPAGRELVPTMVQPVQDQGIELGVLVSLIIAGPNAPVGGGGLVWVDIDSGCPIVLRRYE